MDALASFSGTSLSFGRAAGLLAAAVFIYRLGVIVHRAYFNGLSKFPGPKINAITYIPYLWQSKITGTFTKNTLELHKKYGPVVRISPDTVSMDGSLAWPLVFSRRAHQSEFHKFPPFYGPEDSAGIFTAPREQHRLQRRIMGHAFSESALREQWPLIKTYVDTLMQRFKELADDDKLIDVCQWFNYLTFDIIGDLAFADPFNSLANGTFDPWVAMIFKSIKSFAQMQLLLHYRLLRPLLWVLVDKENFRLAAEQKSLAVNKAEKRIAMGVNESRKDFMTYILRHNTNGKNGMNHHDLLKNAEGFIVAGSETTATALCGFCFLIGQNRQAYNLLVAEIRNAFASEDQINMITTNSLLYLHACLEETLRLYPPAAEVPPRISPGDFINDDMYIHKGARVSVYQWSTHRSERNFADPETFAPQRFLPASHPLYEEKYASDNKAAFRPFAAGPRDCIGKNLAYAEMRVVVARMLWKFEMELQPGQGDWLSAQKIFSVFDKGPLNIKLRPVVR
ncbi:hypothetical protein PspLS_11865 [Pyricularia sp. CBS 133598]|nr:hypothetical protein PspLS_11865 [Pyricularia sp. CBS 133598]